MVLPLVACAYAAGGDVACLVGVAERVGVALGADCVDGGGERGVEETEEGEEGGEEEGGGGVHFYGGCGGGGGSIKSESGYI